MGAALASFFRWLLPTLQIAFTARFVNGALLAAAGTQGFDALLFPLLALLLIHLLEGVFSLLIRLFLSRMEVKAQQELRFRLLEDWASLPFAQSENKEAWDRYKRLSDQPEKQLVKLYAASLALGGMALQMAGLLGVLAGSLWWSALLLFLALLLALRLAFRQGRGAYAVYAESTALQREVDAWWEVLTGPAAVAERNVFQYQDQARAHAEKIFHKAAKKKRQYTVRWMAGMKGLSSGMSLLVFLMASSLLLPVSEGKITVGLFIGLVHAALQLVSVLSWDFADRLHELSQSLAFVEELEAFAKEASQSEALVGKAKPLLIHSIVCKDLSFAYPGTKDLVLDQIHLRLEAGKHYALVGRNGSGKTSLVKLLAGLYENFTGAILVNGRPIQSYTEAERKGMVAILFQDFTHYPLSLYENIAIGQVAERSPEQEQAVEAALRAFDLTELLSKLPRGAETSLHRLEAEGTELSGGEWQRIALARLMHATASFCILDEPTAALDPLSESKLYEAFGSLHQGKMSLYISHRLASTKLADKIFVLDQGRLVQEGSHAELMEEAGIYQEMYAQQRAWYQ